jgi:uncharacterized membrane protein YccC
MTIGKLSEWFVAKDSPPTPAHTIQTAAGAVTSYLIARFFRLPEAYWAPITTLVVMQTTLNAALPFSAQYFAGTAVGALLGAFIDHYFPGSIWAFGAGVLVIGLLGVALQVPRSAYRYASITMAIVMLVTRSTSAKLVAFHRFFEVSLGLAVGLAFFALWQKVSVGFPANRRARNSA